MLIKIISLSSHDSNHINLSLICRHARTDYSDSEPTSHCSYGLVLRA